MNLLAVKNRLRYNHAIWHNDDAVAHSSIPPLTVGDDGGACGEGVPGRD